MIIPHKLVEDLKAAGLPALSAGIGIDPDDYVPEHPDRTEIVTVTGADGASHTCRIIFETRLGRVRKKRLSEFLATYRPAHRMETTVADILEELLSDTPDPVKRAKFRAHLQRRRSS